MSPSRLHLILLVALSAAVACDRPTAPQVRDQTEKIQERLFSGRSSAFAAELQRMLTEGLDRGNSFFPTDSVEIQGPSGPTRYIATVMERVYVPPASSGGGPYTRRMLLVWDRESRGGYALAADDSLSTVVFPTRENQDPTGAAHLWGRPGFVTQIAHDGRDAWFGIEGEIEFATIGPIGPCPFKGVGVTAGFAFIDREPEGTEESCQQLQYRVSANAVLEDRDPSDPPGLVDRLVKRRLPMRMFGQTVRGTRIVTHCPEPAGGPFVMGCATPFSFWRNPSSFARELGVDLSRLQQSPQDNFFFYPLVEGTGETFDCCNDSWRTVRYTVRDAKGVIYRHVDSTIAANDSVLRDRFVGSRILRDGSRTLILVPGRHFNRAASQYAVYVLDISVLH